jgi:EmrB/QacA subfamily drug resistance transporter
MQAYQTGRRLERELVVLGAVVATGAVTAILDATVVNVAVPTLGRDFHASISTLQWVVTAYLLAFASVIPLSGWAAERFGARRVWIAALAVFMTGSILAGLAPSIAALIAFRALQGLGGGLIMPVGQALLARAAGPERIGRVMSIVGIPMLLAPIFGPVVGGAIVDASSWRWIFFVNVPSGLLAIGLARRYLPAGSARPSAPLDARGLALLSPGLAILVYGLSEAGRAGGPGAGRTVAALVTGAVLIALFVLHGRRRGRGALIDVGLFANRGFAAAAATNLLVGIALFGALILLPLYYVVVRGETPLATGLLLVPQGLGAALAMPVAGRLTDRVGARRVIPTGLVLALGGTLAYTQVGASTSYAFLAAALFLVGLGLGATVMPSMAVAYASVAREQAGQATSAINVIQRIAASVGTALLAVVLQRRIAAHGLQGGLSVLGGSARDAEALAAAFGETFWVAAALGAAALGAALFLPRSARLERGGAGRLGGGPGTGRQHRAREDEREADSHARREALVEDCDAEHGGDRRVDVRDHRGAHGPDLGDEREEQHESHGGTDERQGHDGGERARGGQLARSAESRDRCVRRRRERQRERDHAQRRQVRQPALQDRGPDRVADRDAGDLRQRGRARALDVQADDRRDADEADEQSDHAARAEPFTCSCRRRDDGADERHRRDQEAGE